MPNLWPLRRKSRICFATTGESEKRRLSDAIELNNETRATNCLSHSKRASRPGQSNAARRFCGMSVWGFSRRIFFGSTSQGLTLTTALHHTESSTTSMT